MEQSDTAIIYPNRIYSLTDAASLLPSARAGKKVHPRTLRRWLQEGVVKGVRRQTSPTRIQWFIRGSDLLRFLGVSPTFSRLN